MAEHVDYESLNDFNDSKGEDGSDTIGFIEPSDKKPERHIRAVHTMECCPFQNFFSKYYLFN